MRQSSADRPATWPRGPAATHPVLSRQPSAQRHAGV